MPTAARTLTLAVSSILLLVGSPVGDSAATQAPVASLQSHQTSSGADPVQHDRTPGRDGVTHPRALREVPPRYAVEAVRRRIMGTVLMECTVEADGTVGSVRLLRPLDSTFGFDAEALEAAQQWLFEPATDGGAPVPATITIELGSGLNGSWFGWAAAPPRDATAAVWPDTFPDIVAGNRAGRHWATSTFESKGLEATVSHPPNWLVRTSSQIPGSEWFAIVSPDGTRLVLAGHPSTIRSPLPLPTRRLTAAQAAEQRDRLAENFQRSGVRAVVYGVGTTDVGDVSWIWNDYSAPALDVSPRLRSLKFLTRGRVRVWVFMGRWNERSVTVYCRVAYDEATEAEGARREREAKADFAAVLASLSFKNK